MKHVTAVDAALGARASTLPHVFTQLSLPALEIMEEKQEVFFFINLIFSHSSVLITKH